MFTNKFFTTPTALNKAIDDILVAMDSTEPGTKEYAAMASQLTQLYKLKEIDVNLLLKEFEAQAKRDDAHYDRQHRDLDFRQKLKELKLPFGMKPETVALIAANLLGIALILNHERLNVVTTKAFGMLKKS